MFYFAFGLIASGILGWVLGGLLTWKDKRLWIIVVMLVIYGGCRYSDGREFGYKEAIKISEAKQTEREQYTKHLEEAINELDKLAQEYEKNRGK